MAQDAPADTAGPSSPPPRLPEGWLPQWEGVQRQWYYVQRATGKSQWDIPTEPVALSPSTTPTSIGTGPSQAPPSRPSTNSPSVTTTGNSLVERMESAADRTRISSSLSSPLSGQLSTPIHGAADTLGWHSAHGIQHRSHPYAPQFASGTGGKAADQFHHAVPGIPNQRADYSDQGQYLVQNHPQPWGDHGQMSKPHPIGSAADPSAEQYRSFRMDVQQQPQISAYAPSIAYTGNANSTSHQSGFPPSQPPQPQWQLGGPHAKPSHVSLASSTHYTLPGLSQPLYSSNTTAQTGGQHPGELPLSTTQSSFPSHPGNVYSGNQMEMQHSHGLVPAQSHANTNQATNIPGHSLSQSHSQQSMGFQHDQHGGLGAGSQVQPPLHEYGTRRSSTQSSYQNNTILQTQPGPGFNSMVFPTAPSAHGSAQYFQNPIVQAGVHHYLPHQPQSSMHNGTTNHRGSNYHPQTSQLPPHQDQWTTSASASRIAASDIQFVSGPWASSTPPTSGPPQQPHYD